MAGGCVNVSLAFGFAVWFVGATIKIKCDIQGVHYGDVSLYGDFKAKVVEGCV